MSHLARVAGLVFNQPLLALEDTATVIASVFADRFDVAPMRDDVARLPFEEVEAIRASRFVGKPDGPRDENGVTRPMYRVQDGIALISIMGELVNRGAWVGASSGLTSYEGIAAQLEAARASENVRGIILDINSPGGEAGGAIETGRLVRAIAKEKPVVAFVNSVAASAAYAIAAGATRIIATESGLVGSIGVIVLHLDRTQALEKAGVKPTILRSVPHKAEGSAAEQLSSAAAGRLQARINAMHGIFAGFVADMRSISIDAVNDLKGEVRIGREGVEAGLADQIGGLDDAFAFLNRARTGGRETLGNGGFMSETKATGAETGITQAALDAAVATARAEGEKSGAKLATDRIKAILTAPQSEGRAATAHKFAFDTELPADQALAILETTPKASAEPARPALGAVVPRPEVQPDAPQAGEQSQIAQRVSALQAAVPEHMRVRG